MSKLIERDGKRFIEVGPNDSFGSIAYEHTGQSSRWLELLKCNDVDGTKPIVSGILLTVPEAWVQEMTAPPQTDAIGEPAPAAALGDPPSFREEIKAQLKELFGAWFAKTDETFVNLSDKVALLEMKRDQDEKRIAEQGAQIITLEAKIAALTTAPTAPAPPQPPAMSPVAEAKG